MSLRQWFERNGDRRYIMFGGKGGLGKTTFSAATAYWLARQGHRVLVFSVDPQASLSDIFERDIVVKGDYDYYIYDLVPLGHALYYLSMAKVYDEWINRITQLREQMREHEEMVVRIKRQKVTEEDQILHELQYIRGRINQSSSILTDKERTAFFFVIVPEQMIILDTEKATELFSRFDVPIAGYVVNRVLPEELARQRVPPYLQNRLAVQGRYLEQIKRTFGDRLVGSVPELERDVTGLPMIEKLAAIMYGDGRG